jgi:serine/threonine-protein kinase RsbW
MTGWDMRRPPRIDEELARWTLAGALELQVLRAALQQAVNDQPAAADPMDLAERLTIVATELAGNALRHGHPPTVVVLQRANEELVVAVLDNDPGSAPAVDGDRAVGEGGLGLVLAQRLALDVGWYPTDTGKGVWATFALAGQ